MKPYIYDARNDIHIIDLQITAKEIEKAFKFVYESVKNGATVLFVGKKKQAKDAIQAEAERCGMFYMNNRWLGGTLTNFVTIKKRIDSLHKLEQSEKMGEFQQYSKKEAMKLRQLKDKLELDLGGIKNMRKPPDIMFVVDLKMEETAIKEARKLNIPIVGLVDTNCDPDLVDFVIPGNDDAIRAIKLITGVIADAVISASEGTDYVAGSFTEEAYLASLEDETETQATKTSVEDMDNKVTTVKPKADEPKKVVAKEEKVATKKVVENNKADETKKAVAKDIAEEKQKNSINKEKVEAKKVVAKETEDDANKVSTKAKSEKTKKAATKEKVEVAKKASTKEKVVEKVTDNKK